MNGTKQGANLIGATEEHDKIGSCDSSINRSHGGASDLAAVLPPGAGRRPPLARFYGIGCNGIEPTAKRNVALGRRAGGSDRLNGLTTTDGIECFSFFFFLNGPTTAKLGWATGYAAAHPAYPVAPPLLYIYQYPKIHIYRVFNIKIEVSVQ